MVTVPRLLTAVLLAAFGCLLAVGIAWRPTPSSVVPVVAAAPDRVAPLAVLAAWDRDRADAWERGDGRALSRLYAEGSRAGRADRRLLTAYAGRGLRVQGLRMQRASVEVVAASSDRLVLVVTDRLVGGTAVGPRGRVALPDDTWSRRRVVLREGAGGWRVVEVRPGRTPAPT